MAILNKKIKNKSCVLIWNGENCDRKWFSVIQNGRRRPFCQKFKKKVAHWSEMARNAIKSDFQSSKMAAGGHFVKKIFQKCKVAYWSEMARNAIKTDFRSSKMLHFVKNSKCFILWKIQKKVAYWSEMARNAIESDFRSSKMADVGNFVKNLKEVAYWSEMTRNAIESDFRWSKMAGFGDFVKKNKIKEVL